MSETEQHSLAESLYYDSWEFAAFQQKLARLDDTEMRQSVGGGGGSFEESFYLELIEKFVRTGECPPDQTGEPLCDYLIGIMNEPTMRVLILTDDVRARIFQDNMMRLVDMALNRKRFSFARRQSERQGVAETLEWSLDKRRDGEQALLDTLETKYGKYGFRSSFYRRQFSDPKNLGNDALWESLYKEYCQALQECIRDEKRRVVDDNAVSSRKRLEQLLHIIPEYLEKNGVEKEDFFQAWNMMGGEWNEYDFKRFLRMARLQRDYPELKKLANRMGRIIDADGAKTLWVGSGKTQELEHSSKSDIQGITIGRQLDSLLPLEMAQMSDDDCEELFLMKFATNKLQTFRHKSEQLAPNKRLERKRARQKGPMIVCVDTSGSMEGRPQQIANSIVLRLVDMAYSQKRDLYLIAFSVSAHPIDVKRDKVRLLDFFTHASTGDTNAEKMMQHTLTLLNQKPEYMSADVLLVGDFRMPLVPAPMLDAILKHRQQGTYFYGLQIGLYPGNKWKDQFDKIYTVEYDVARRF